MPIASLKHASLHYLLEDLEGAPVVVLSNSLGTELSLWNGQAAELARQFRVLRYDTRGHGGSTAAGSAFSLDDLGNDVLELLDVLSIEQFHVCGISLGGMTALWLAIHAPARVLSVMACNTAAKIGNELSWNGRIEQIEKHGIRSIADQTMERWFTAGFRRDHPERVEEMRQMVIRTDAQGYMACCAALLDADLTSAIAGIAAPALVVSGTHDPVTTPADGRYLAGNIPGAEYVELDASHLSNVEQPKRFLEAMLDLLG